MVVLTLVEFWSRIQGIGLAGAPALTKKEIVKTISEEIGLTQLKTKEIVQKTFDAIVETLVTEGRIELRNFGVFEVKKRAARRARNPRTGDRVSVPEKWVVTFKPGKEMEQRVREMSENATAEQAEGLPSDSPSGSTTSNSNLSNPIPPGQTDHSNPTPGPNNDTSGSAGF